jgi:hypothetical protein
VCVSWDQECGFVVCGENSSVSCVRHQGNVTCISIKSLLNNQSRTIVVQQVNQVGSNLSCKGRGVIRLQK